MRTNWAHAFFFFYTDDNSCRAVIVPKCNFSLENCAVDGCSVSAACSFVAARVVKDQMMQLHGCRRRTSTIHRSALYFDVRALISMNVRFLL